MDKSKEKCLRSLCCNLFWRDWCGIFMTLREMFILFWVWSKWSESSCLLRMMSFKRRTFERFERQNNPLQKQQHCPQINTNEQHKPEISHNAITSVISPWRSSSQHNNMTLPVSPRQHRCLCIIHTWRTFRLVMV